jgi:transposase
VASSEAKPTGRSGHESATATSSPAIEPLRNGYVRDGLSAREIAERLQTTHATVTRRLRRLGVNVAPRGIGRARPRRRLSDPPGLAEVLAELYGQERLLSSVVAAKLDLPERRVRDQLHQLGVPIRTREGPIARTAGDSRPTRCRASTSRLA